MICSSPSHENKICCYCGNQIKFIYESSDIENYECVNCNAIFKYCEGFKQITELYTKINDTTYKVVSNGFGTFISYEYIMYYSDKYIHNKTVKMSEVIKQFSLNDMPHITPQNINEKIKLILTFL